MSKISPKLIDVERNRVEFRNETDNRVGTDKSDGRKTISKMFSSNVNNISPMFNTIGRFPTQLFTNIKNDRYKYVKNIA